MYYLNVINQLEMLVNSSPLASRRDHTDKKLKIKKLNHKLYTFNNNIITAQVAHIK